MKVVIESRNAPVIEEYKTGELYVYDQDQHDAKYVVLVTGKRANNFSGTVVASNTDAKPIGYTSTGFNQYAFQRFYGRITMES